jgi:5-methylcytosine-specific restriction endonuclease McrA
MTPHKVVSWQDAIILMFRGVARVVEEYDEILAKLHFDQLIQYEHLANAIPQEGEDDLIFLRTPAVITLTTSIVSLRNGVKFSRINVLTRDNFQCQYCGHRASLRDLTYDHVLPKCQGGKTTWDNIVTACRACNAKKSNRTPEQAEMNLCRLPVKPKVLPVSIFRLNRHGNIPSVWSDYCVGLIGEECVL